MNQEDKERELLKLIDALLHLCRDAQIDGEFLDAPGRRARADRIERRLREIQGQ